MFNLTPVVKNLLIVNVIVFVAQKILVDSHITEYLALWSVGTANFKPYQLFTYMFAHADFGHILYNMLGLILAGPMLESLWGQKKFLLFFLITGIGAGVFNIVLDMFLNVGSFSYMIGASGAVYGLITAFGILFADMEVKMLFLPISFKAKYIAIVMGSLAIYQVMMPNPGDHVAHFAHLGGIAIAIIVLQIWKKNGSYR